MIRRPAPARPAALLRAIGLAVALTVTLALVACGDAGPNTPPEPVAVAGPAQTVAVGAFVVLDGRASQHADAFAWSFGARPSGSAAAIADADEALAGFLADVAGTFEVALDVSGPGGTDRDTLTVIAGPAGEMLTPGGILFGEDGVALAALPGALEAAIEAYATMVPAPVTPLPPGSSVLGSFVLLGSRDGVAAAANPFLVALPVPEEADTARLAMAALLLPNDVTGTYLGEPPWDLVPGLGFRGPNLPRSFDLAQTAINLVEGEIDVVFGPYEVQLRPYRSVAQDADTWPCGIRPDGSGNGGGYSFGFTTSLFVCIDDDGLYDPLGSPKPAVATARHELFHAIQFAYPNVGDGSRGRDLWIIEGTAVASEFSSASMQRSPHRNPREIEVGLTVTDDGLPHLGIEVTANVWPTVHIESPRDGGWYRAENPLPLRAVITGADAGVRARPVEWWVRVVSPDTQWRLASSSGETLHFRTVDACCDADVEVEAVVDPGALIAEIGLLTDFRRVALGGRSPGPLCGLSSPRPRARCTTWRCARAFPGCSSWRR